MISSAVSTDLVEEVTVVLDEEESVSVPPAVLRLVSFTFVEDVVVVVDARKAHFKLNGSVFIDLFVVLLFPVVGKSSENARFLGDSDVRLEGILMGSVSGVSEMGLLRKTIC